MVIIFFKKVFSSETIEKSQMTSKVLPSLKMVLWIDLFLQVYKRPECK